MNGLHVGATARERTTDVHEAGAVTTGADGCAGCLSTLSALTLTMAPETSGFLKEKVPPKPQHWSMPLNLGVPDTSTGADQVLLAGAQAGADAYRGRAVVGDVLE